MDPLLQVWNSDTAPPLENYGLGSWGPQSADELLAHAVRMWHYSCAKHD
ncbi:MAG: hypothetical protein J7L35_06065 [Anaerolineales bacterium]|nr:hypothetical protein [Anaerolineales bacterium]